MIRAIYRKGKIQPVDAVPQDWADGQELVVEEALTNPDLSREDGWLMELQTAAARIPARVHDEIATVRARQEAESKDQVRHEMERSE